jgi:hypothetical protein
MQNAKIDHANIGQRIPKLADNAPNEILGKIVNRLNSKSATVTEILFSRKFW